MGYRSEVAYVITFKDTPTKQQWVALTKLNAQFNKALKECNHVDNLEKDYISAHFRDVKWYDGYEDVDMHMHMLDSISEDEPDGVNARFIRIGESSDDAQDDAYGEDGYSIDLYLSRVIDTEYEL